MKRYRVEIISNGKVKYIPFDDLNKAIVSAKTYSKITNSQGVVEINYTKNNDEKWHETNIMFHSGKPVKE